MGLVISNATLAQLAPRMVRPGHLLIEGSTIAGVFDEIPSGYHEVFDAHGALVMPGNVCSHTHLYSVLARGMPAPPKNPRNFPEILEYIWWRLDRALDEPSIRASGIIGAMEAVLSGTTTLIDHHASPNCIEGSLDMLAEGMARVGVRGVLCYEVTDRNGADGRDSGLKENVRFAHEYGFRFPLMRPMLGAHASFTLNDDSLESISGTAHDLALGIHIHVAEDVCDQTDSMQRTGKRVAYRLDGHGIMGAKSILAHCVHLDEAEIGLVGRRGSWVAHNCRSNLNNSVGRAPVRSLLRELGGKIVMGTDGIDQDMFAESRTAYFRSREEALDAFAEQFTDVLAAGADRVEESFGSPIGRLEAGNLADLQILNYQPPTPLTAANLAWHWTFAFTNQLVKDVMVAGRWVVRDRQLVRVDAEEALAVGRTQAEALWQRMHDLPW